MVLVHDDADLDVQRQLAARATKAWIVSLGLAAATEELRLRETDSTPIPAPGLEQLLEEVRGLATDVVDAAELALERAEYDGDPATLAPYSGVDGIATAVAPVLAAERLARRIAQVALGVTSHAPWTDDVARLERAAVEVVSPYANGSLEDVVEDGFELLSFERDGLRSEIAGAVCRVLCEIGRHKLTIGVSAERAVVLAFDDWGTVHGSVEGAYDLAEQLVALGWDAHPDHTIACTWESPVTAIEIADLVVTTLFDALGAVTVADLEVTVDLWELPVTPREPDASGFLGRPFGRPAS